jgi:hypothetical protein
MEPIGERCAVLPVSPRAHEDSPSTAGDGSEWPLPSNQRSLGSVDVTIDSLAWGLVALGTIACLLRYGLRFPIWPDEAFIALNVARRDVAGILEPLQFHQAAPPLFLLQETVLTHILRFNEWTLRAMPLLFGVSSMLLFRVLARSILTGWAYMLAVGVFCSSYLIIRYSAEAKPYSGDVFMSVALLVLAVRWAHGSRRWLVLILLTGLSLVAFAFSFPSVFVGGGVAAFMAHRALMQKDARRILETLLVIGALAAGSCAVYSLHTRHQLDREIAWMQWYWARGFPPGDSIGGALLWLLRGAAGELMPYPVGGRNAGSTLTLICFVAGIVDFVRARRKGLLVLLGVTVGLALAAAVMRRYSFGAPARAQLYLAPLIILYVGAGLARLLTLRSTLQQARTRSCIAMIVLAAVAVVSMGRDIVKPAKTTSDQIVRDWSRIILRSASLAGVPAFSLREDFGMSFSPGDDEEQSLLPSFLCNLYIYGSPGRRRSGGPDLSCGGLVVTYRVADRVDAVRRREWIESVSSRFDVRLEGTVVLPVPDVDNHERMRRIDTIEVMRFVPGSDRDA